MSDTQPTLRDFLTLRSFGNALRILMSIDLDECHEVGLFQNEKHWTAFRDDPFRFFMRADDLTQQRIWKIVERRSEGRIRTDNENQAASISMSVPQADVAMIALTDDKGAVMAQISLPGSTFMNLVRITADGLVSMSKAVAEAELASTVRPSKNGGVLQ